MGPYNLRIVPHVDIKYGRNTHLYKRAYNPAYGFDPSNTYLTEAQRFFAIAYPPLGVAWNVKQLRIVSSDIELLANTSKIAIDALQSEIDSLAKTVAQTRISVDFLFLNQGGLCKWLNQSCCFYINKSGTIEESLYKIQQITDSVRKTEGPMGNWWDSLWSWLPGMGWVKTIIMYLIVIVVMLVFLCCCIQCIPSLMNVFKNMCAKQHSSGLTNRQLYTVRYQALARA